jgi:hypothetical protein
MCGKVTPRESPIRPPVVWLRATLMPTLIAVVTSHEARHMYQHLDEEQFSDYSVDELEADAKEWQGANERYFRGLAREIMRRLPKTEAVR